MPLSTVDDWLHERIHERRQGAAGGKGNQCAQEKEHQYQWP